MSYYYKYKKYKNKYLQLNKLLNGGNIDYINKLKQLYPNCEHDKNNIDRQKISKLSNNLW